MIQSKKTLLVPQVEISASWALNLMCAFDDIAPGLLAGYLTSGERRRQIINAALAAMPFIHGMDGREDVALLEIPVSHDLNNLLVSREVDVIERHYGRCPQGFLGALAKVGTKPQAPEFYRDLFAVMTTPKEWSVARAIAHLDRVSQEQIDLTRELPENWRNPKLIEKLGTYRETRKFLRAIELIRHWCEDATDTALDAGIEALSREGTVAKFVARWVGRAKFPAGPIRSSSKLVQIQDATELNRIALYMKNCLRDQIDDILDGTSVYYTTQVLKTPLIVHLRRSNSAEPWIFEDVYARFNGPVEPSLRRITEGILIEHGFDPHRRGQATEADMQDIRNYLWSAQHDRRAA